MNEMKNSFLLEETIYFLKLKFYKIINNSISKNLIFMIIIFAFFYFVSKTIKLVLTKYKFCHVSNNNNYSTSMAFS